MSERPIEVESNQPWPANATNAPSSTCGCPPAVRPIPTTTPKASPSRPNAKRACARPTSWGARSSMSTSTAASPPPDGQSSRLPADARPHPHATDDVDYVIVYKLSRFARNRSDDAIVMADLRKHKA